MNASNAKKPPRVLSYFTRGEGPRPTILLHGFLGSGRNLASLAARWAEAAPERRLLVPDLLGHGASPPLPESPSLAALAGATLAFADALALPLPIDVVGHSLGGKVALAMAQERPEAIGRVAALDISPSAAASHGHATKQPGSRSDDDRPLTSQEDTLSAVLAALLDAPARAESRAEMRTILLRGGLDVALSDWLMMNLEASDGALSWRIDRPALARLHAALRTVDQWPVAAALGGRLVCIAGERSRFLPREERRRLQELGVRVEVLANAGHFLHVDQPAALLDRLRAHFEDDFEDQEENKEP